MHTPNSHIPLVVDASSDVASKPIEWNDANVGIYFAGASKNIGIPGVTLVVIRRNLLWYNLFDTSLNYFFIWFFLFFLRHGILLFIDIFLFYFFMLFFLCLGI